MALHSLMKLAFATTVLAGSIAVPMTASAESGIATYYSGRGAGLTAAHRTLPFGTRVRVTNTRNGHSVVVRITDRGPYGRGKVIDVNRAAAHALGIYRLGIAPVTLKVLGRG